MAKTSDQKEALVGIRSDITLLAGELLKDGNISPQFLAAHIVDVANNIAKQGGPMSEFEHSLWMQKLGTNLVRVFEHNYKDKLDWAALIKGDLVPLDKAINYPRPSAFLRHLCRAGDPPLAAWVLTASPCSLARA